MTPLFGKFKEVRCPDGPRLLLKDPNKAFSILFPEYKTLLKAIIKDLAKVDFSLKKQTKSLVEGLSEDYAMAQAHYKIVYITFCGNPCNKEAYENLKEETKEIRKQIFELQKMRRREHTI